MNPNKEITYKKALIGWNTPATMTIIPMIAWGNIMWSNLTDSTPQTKPHIANNNPRTWKTMQCKLNIKPSFILTYQGIANRVMLGKMGQGDKMGNLRSKTKWNKTV